MTNPVKVSLNFREAFIMEFSGGPYDTQRHEAPGQLDWPLPEVVFARSRNKKIIENGYYVKEWESKGKARNTTEARGAVYKWREDEQRQEAGDLV